MPPHLYGGTERVVSYLTEELVRRGEDVTLFASGDSKTTAKLVPACERSLRMTKAVDTLALHIVMLEEVIKRAGEFDIVHFHIDYLHYPLSRRTRLNHVTTLHGRLDLPNLSPLYREFTDIPVISISDSQRRPLPFAHWAGTVYHGLPPDEFNFRADPEDYLLFLGRISPEKRGQTVIISTSTLNTCSISLSLTSSAKSAVRTQTNLSAVPRLYCSRLIGPNRLVWS